MSEQAKMELKLGVITVLITVMGSLTATVWYSAQLAHKVEMNAEHLRQIDAKIAKITELIIKEKR